jgi:hypothetical protein
MQAKPMRRITFLFLLLLPCSAFALERDLRNGVESVAGIYSSIAVHEAGHALVYKLLGGTNITVEVPRRGSILGGRTTANFAEPLTQDQVQLAAVSGLVAANLAGELVLQRKGLHRSPYAQAVLGTSVISNLLHVKNYYTRVRGVNGYAGNDIDQYELAGGNPHLMSAALTGYTLWTLHRMRKSEVPLFYVNLRF